jgi:hypothetical protein
MAVLVSAVCMQFVLVVMLVVCALEAVVFHDRSARVSLWVFSLFPTN